MDRMHNIVRRLADAGIRLTSYREADMIDLSSPHGELVLSVFAFLAKQESSIKSERAKRGIEAARAKSVRIGRPPGSRDKRKRTRRFFRTPVEARVKTSLQSQLQKPPEIGVSKWHAFKSGSRPEELGAMLLGRDL